MDTAEKPTEELNKKDTHFHFIFWFYAKKDPVGNFYDNVVIDVIADTFPEAVLKANEIARYKDFNLGESRNNSFLKSCVEHYNGQCK